jgi:hypothetical protein
LTEAGNGVYVGVSLGAEFSCADQMKDNNKDHVFFANEPAHSFGVVRSKKRVNNVAYGVFVGAKGGEQWYYAAELGVNFGHPSAKKTLNDFEAKEGYMLDLQDGEEQIARGTPVENIKVFCGNEYEASLKFGSRNFLGKPNIAVYGIIGTCLRKVDVKYDYNENAEIWYGGGDERFREPTIYKVKYQKNVWGATIGAGIDVRVNKHCSVGLEYKHKFYDSVKYSINTIPVEAHPDAPLAEPPSAGPRHYKTKVGHDSICLNLSINL